MAEMEQDIAENASGEEEQQEQLPQNDPPQMQQQAAASAPPAQQNKKGNRKQPEHPCVACGKNVSSNAVQCTMCTLWCHRACTNLSNEAFKGLEAQVREVGVAYWACRACLSFANKVNRQLQATSKRQDEVEARVEENAKKTENNSQEIVKLREELNRVRMTLENERGERNDMLCEELRDRELRRNNIVIHGLQEPNESFNRARIEQDKIECGNLLAAMGIKMRQEDLRFWRRVGERGQESRPIIIGLRTEEEKRIILERARLLRGTRYDNVAIVPDMTKMQRRAEDKLTREAEDRNEQLTAEDRNRNLKWLVVGRRGEKRLIKGTEREGQNNIRRGIQLSDFVQQSQGAPGGSAFSSRGRGLIGGSSGPAQNMSAPVVPLPMGRGGEQ
jgi:membrane-associated HD superfamily phosphohydrolase